MNVLSLDGLGSVRLSGNVYELVRYALDASATDKPAAMTALERAKALSKGNVELRNAIDMAISALANENAGFTPSISSHEAILRVLDMLTPPKRVPVERVRRERPQAVRRGRRTPAPPTPTPQPQPQPTAPVSVEQQTTTPTVQPSPEPRPSPEPQPSPEAEQPPAEEGKVIPFPSRKEEKPILKWLIIAALIYLFLFEGRE